MIAAIVVSGVVGLVIALVLLGLLCWGANQLPIPAQVKSVILVVVVILAVLLALDFFFGTSSPTIRTDGPVLFHDR